MIIITSDHGESFAEFHNNGKTRLLSHAGTPYDFQIRIPLIMKMPEHMTEGHLVVKDDVTLLDLAPTILTVLGIDPPPHYRGRSILPQFRPTTPREFPFIFSTNTRGDDCIRQNGKKFIHLSSGAEEYYDLLADPHEKNNLADAENPKMEQLRNTYFDFIDHIGKAELDFESVAEGRPSDLEVRLKALGYLD